MVGREISYDFISELRLEFLEDPTLGVSEVSRCVYLWQKFLE